MTDMLMIAIKNVRRKFSRTILTAIGIAIGVASVVIINSVGDIGIATFNNELDSLGIDGIVVSPNTEETGATLDRTDTEILQKLSYVQTAMPVINLSGKTTANGISEDILLWGVNDDAGDVISLNILYGRMMDARDVAEKRTVCLLDEALSEKLFNRKNSVGSTVMLNVDGISDQYEIIGIVSTDSSILRSVAGSFVPDFVYTPYTTASLFSNGNLSQIAVRLNDGVNIDTAISRIKNLLTSVKGQKDSISAENLAKQRTRIESMLSIVKGVFTAIGAISIIVSSFGTMNIMLMTVRERTREIGIKKALGAKNHTIMIEFLCEAVIISFIGSFIGALIGIAITSIGAAIIGQRLVLSPIWIVLSISISVVLGALFGVYPARKAAKMNPVYALGRD